MTVPQTLSAPPALHRVARALTASLPMSLRFIEEVGTADVMLVDGTRPWAAPTQALVDRGIARIVVIAPGDDDPEAIVALAQCAGAGTTVVTLAEIHAGNPAVDPFRDGLGEGFTTLVIDGMATMPVAPSLLSQVRIARALGWCDPGIRDVRITGNGAIVTAEAHVGMQRGVLRMIVCVTAAVAPRQRVRAYAAAALAELMLPAADTARPATTRIVRAGGLVSLPTLYEIAGRVALRAPPPRVTGAAALFAFAADVALVRAIAGRRS